MHRLRYHVQVVVAGVVVAKALFWTDIVTVFGLLATDFGPGCYDHLNYNHLSAVLTPERSLASGRFRGVSRAPKVLYGQKGYFG